MVTAWREPASDIESGPSLAALQTIVAGGGPCFLLDQFPMGCGAGKAGSANWRWVFVTGVIPSVIFFLPLLRAPETPRYLFLAGRESEGLAILERIAGSASAESEAVEIRASLAVKRHAWLDLLRPGIRRAVAVGFVLAILVHVSGINTIIDYAPTILRSAGWELDAALFSTFIRR